MHTIGYAWIFNYYYFTRLIYFAYISSLTIPPTVCKSLNQNQIGSFVGELFVPLFQHCQSFLLSTPIIICNVLHFLLLKIQMWPNNFKRMATISQLLKNSGIFSTFSIQALNCSVRVCNDFQQIWCKSWSG